MGPVPGHTDVAGLVLLSPCHGRVTEENHPRPQAMGGTVGEKGRGTAILIVHMKATINDINIL